MNISVRRQRGVVTIEYALMLMFGLVPLLLFTFSGVLIMAAQQTLATASAEGARASLGFGTSAQRQVAACEAARRSMQWLLTFSAQAPDCSSGGSGAIAVSAPEPCSGLPTASCMTVTTTYDYARYPFMPGTGRVYGWVMTDAIRSTAVAQLDLGSSN